MLSIKLPFFSLGMWKHILFWHAECDLFQTRCFISLRQGSKRDYKKNRSKGKIIAKKESLIQNGGDGIHGVFKVLKILYSLKRICLQQEECQQIVQLLKIPLYQKVVSELSENISHTEGEAQVMLMLFIIQQIF